MIDITDFIISYTKFIEAQIRDRQGIQWNNGHIIKIFFMNQFDSAKIKYAPSESISTHK